MAASIGNSIDQLGRHLPPTSPQRRQEGAPQPTPLNRLEECPPRKRPGAAG